MVRIPLKWFECGFESFDSLLNRSHLHSKTSNGSNLHSSARIAFEWCEFAFECLESLSKGSKLDLKALNPFRMV